MQLISIDNINLVFSGRRESLKSEITIQELAEYLTGLTGKYACDSIVEQASQVVSYLGEGQQGVLKIQVSNGKLQGRALTSLLGPGFHQIVIELLETMAKALQLTLDIQDPTGYWQNRNFAKLQQTYINWLADNLEKLAQCGGQHYFDWEQGVEWAAYGDGIPLRVEQLLTPMGAFTAEYIQEVARNHDWWNFAQDYFHWFDANQDAYYYRNAALYDLWNSRWTEQAEFILKKFKKARQLNANIPIPLRAVQELAELAGETADFGGPDMPLPAQAGYCRGFIRYLLPQGWCVTLPGEFTMEAEYDDDENIIYPITFYSGDKHARFLYTFADDGSEEVDSRKIWKQQGEHRYLCLDSFTYEASGGHWQQWKGSVQSPTHSLAVELEGKVAEWDSWAMRVFGSILYIGTQTGKGGLWHDK